MERHHGYLPKITIVQISLFQRSGTHFDYFFFCPPLSIKNKATGQRKRTLNDGPHHGMHTSSLSLQQA